MKGNFRAPKSVPKIRREPSPQHVSDRLRRARNCSHERSTRTNSENSTNKSFKFIRSSDSIQITPRCTVEQDRYDRGRSKRLQMGELTNSNYTDSSQLPDRVLKLVVTPCKKYESQSGNQNCGNGNYDLNIIEICMRVVKELKQEVNGLELSSLNFPCSKNSISGIINEFFLGTNSSSESSTVAVCHRTGLFEYTRTLAVECVDIIEKVILQQNDIVAELNKASKLSTKKKIKTLLLNVILGIEHKLILSERILEIVDTDLHHSSFQFIYCLLKHFIEKIAVHLNVSGESTLDHKSPDISSIESCVIQHTFSGACLSNCKVEEYSTRLDKLLKQWSGTGDSFSNNESSRQVVIDCYHCLTEKEERDLLLKTVSRFTEEIGRKFIECRRDGVRSQFTKNNYEENIGKSSRIEEPSTSDSFCSTEVSTNYSWTITGENRSRFCGSKNLSQYSNRHKPKTDITPNRSHFQDSMKSRSHCRNLPPALAQGSIPGRMCQPISNSQNYLSKPQLVAESNNCRMPPPINRSNYHSKHPPVLSDDKSSRDKSTPTSEMNNYHFKTPNVIGTANNELTMATPIFNNKNRFNIASSNVDDYKYRGSSPLKSSLINGSNYHTRNPPLLVDDRRLRNRSPQMAERNNYQSKSTYIKANAERTPVSNNANRHNMAPLTADYNSYRSTSSSRITMERSNKGRQSPNGINYLTSHSPIDAGRHHQSIPPPRSDSKINIAMASKHSYGNNNFRLPLPLPNFRTKNSPLTFEQFPKLQLPYFDPCGTTNTHCYSHVPRCISQIVANQGHNICNHGNPCKTCLVICENKPKQPYFDGFPDFKGAGFYDYKLVNSFPPQMINTFAVSPELKTQNKKDKKEEKKKLASDMGTKSSVPNERQSLSTNNSGNASQTTAREKENKSNIDISRNEQSQNKDVSRNGDIIQTNQKDTSKSKDNSQNNYGDKLPPMGPRNENAFGDTPPARVPSNANVAKPSTPKTTNLNKPSPETSQRNGDAKIPTQGSKSREDFVEGNSSSKQPDADRTQEDSHCSCCKCKPTKDKVDNAAPFVNPCYCNINEPNGTRPIFQFFANPVPLKCNCQHKSEGVQTARSQHAQGQQRDLQDAETQTAKKPTEPHGSADQVTPAQSEHNQEPCILSSESCTCSMTYSQSDGSRHKKDPGNIEPQKSKSDTKCTCPQDIESIFQNFDDKYSKCVQEIKILIREGYLPRYNGSDESFTVTREITIVPSRSKSISKDDNPSKVPPQHQLEFHESQDKIYSDDTYRATESHDEYQTPTDLRADIEELKRLIKNTRLGHCPCCKCCKCEKGDKSSEECSKPNDQDVPGKYKSEPYLARSQAPSKYSEEGKKEPNKSSENIKEPSKEPARGSETKDDPGRKQSEQSPVRDTLPPPHYFSKMVEPKGVTSKAKDEPRKSEPSSVPGEQLKEYSGKGVEKPVNDSSPNRRQSTNEQKPYQSSRSINERSRSKSKEDQTKYQLEPSSVRFETPTTYSSNETVGSNKEPESKTKGKSGPYETEPSSVEEQPPTKEAPYSDEEIEEANQEPPEGSKIIHITPSYIDPEGLPTVVKDLIVPSESKDPSSPSKGSIRGSNKTSENKAERGKQGARKSQDPNSPSKGSIGGSKKTSETKAEGRKQSTRKSQDPSSPSKGSIGGSNKTSESTTEGGKEGSNVPQGSDLKNREFGVSRKSSKPVVESGNTENLHRESEEGGGSQPTHLDQIRSKGSVEENNQLNTEGEPKTGGRSLQPTTNQESGKSHSSTVTGGASEPLSTMREPKTSVSDRKLTYDTEAGENAERQGTTGPDDQEPSFEAEGEFAGERRGSKGTSQTKTGEQKIVNELPEGDTTETIMKNESEIGVTGRELYQGRETPKKLGSVSDGKAPSPKDSNNNSLMYDDEAVKQRQISLERQALDQSRDKIFTKRGEKSESTVRGEEDFGRSWTPSEGIFGSSRGEVEGGTSRTRGKSDHVGGYSAKMDDKIDDSVLDVPCGPYDEEYSLDDDFNSNPCGSAYESSSTTLDNCEDLFDSHPCGFYSDVSGTSSITEVIKATETELYVMIIESQPPLTQTPDRHDEIISLLLSGNNVTDFYGNSNSENRPTSKSINLDNYPQTNSPYNSYDAGKTLPNGHDTQSCFPFELITVQPSDESTRLDSNIESSEVLLSDSLNDHPLPLENVCSSSFYLINEEMKERKRASYSKREEEPRRRSSSSRKQAEIKERTTLKTQTHKRTKSKDPFDESEFTKSVENKEIQVTKWNAKVQTAGPKKFNRTDIPSEVEDKLAKYLGLERTVEQMDLKITSVEDESQINTKRKPKPKTGIEKMLWKNRQDGKLQNAKER